MENINIFLSFICYSFPTSYGNINLFQNDFYGHLYTKYRLRIRYANKY